MAHGKMATKTMGNDDKKIYGIEKYEAEAAARTLSRSFEIKANEKLFAAAMVIIDRDIANNIKVKGWAGGMKDY